MLFYRARFLYDLRISCLNCIILRKNNFITRFKDKRCSVQAHESLRLRYDYTNNQMQGRALETCKIIRNRLSVNSDVCHS